ncbi:MAG: isochorismatase [Acidobacteriota bacterium]
MWRVPYQELARQAEDWSRRHHLEPAARDSFRMALLAVDLQNTFCCPGFELYVAGRSGQGAVDDTRRLCGFIYRHLDVITRIFPTLDTHQALHIFHTICLVDKGGRHPEPLTRIDAEDVEMGRWRLNPAFLDVLGLDREGARRYLLHYVHRLAECGKPALTIWPYHAMLGGIGHALVSSVEEAVFFHGVARRSPPEFQIKGRHPLTEHYSVFRPDVMEDADGRPLAAANTALLDQLLAFDAIIIAGQAKSHCVAWTVGDLLEALGPSRRELAGKVYLLEDATSPVVVPGGVDTTDAAAAAFSRFAAAGVHVVRTTDRLEDWPGMRIR